MLDLPVMKFSRMAHNRLQESAETSSQAGGKGQVPRHNAKSEGAKKIEQSIAYMTEHLSEPLCISQLSQAVHISSSHFFVLFKRWTGFSPIDYFIRLRMQRGGQLLVSTSMSIKEIAAEMGYDDPFYFSRLFKAVQGMAPSEYRKKNGSPDEANAAQK